MRCNRLTFVAAFLLGCASDGGKQSTDDSGAAKEPIDSRAGTTETPDAGATKVVPCGSLDAVQAAQLATAKLEHFGSVGLAALAGLESSRAPARVVSIGNENAIDGQFVSQSQSDLHDSLVKLRDEQLIPSNVESVEKGIVTFLLRPETLCKSNDGSGDTSSDPECVMKATEHPTRMRVSRISCDQADNVAVELLRDTPAKSIISVQLLADRAEAELDLGALLLASTSTQTGDGQTTSKPAFSAAEGVLHGTLVLNGDARATGSVSITKAIDFTTNDNSATRIRLAAGADVLTMTADGVAKTITAAVKLGAFDMQQALSDFVSNFLGLELTNSASAQNPVQVHAAGLRGELSFDRASDTVVANKLDLGGAVLTAVLGTQKLLSIDVTSAAKGAIAATLTGRADDTAALTLPQGLAVAITYGFEPLMASLQNPANFLAKDTLSISATAGTAVTLSTQSSSDKDLALTNGDPTGMLLRLDSGALSLTSALWPSDAVSVAPNQCLARNQTAQTGHHDLLASFQVTACGQ